MCFHDGSLAEKYLYKPGRSSDILRLLIDDVGERSDALVVLRG